MFLDIETGMRVEVSAADRNTMARQIDDILPGQRSSGVVT